MFSKKKRVNKELFGKIMKTGSTLSGSFFVFKYIYNSQLPQYTFVVSKNIAKKAVDRNRFKRRGFNILRLFPIKNSQGIFFYKKGTKKISTEEIKNDINFLLKKTKII